MKLNSVGVPIAQRELLLSGAANVLVLIGKPELFPDGNGCYCPVQIFGLGDQKVSCPMGQDAMQALVLALEFAGTTLYTSSEWKSGRLTWLGMRNLGFPVPDTIRDLVPPNHLTFEAQRQ
jgi:hypothetical protein